MFLQKNSFSIFWPLFVVVLISLGVASSQRCLNTGFFKPNSTYDNNRRLLLSSLASNVTAQGDYFYNTSFGQEPNKVYAMGMCIPGAEQQFCSDCIKTASDSLLQTCPNQTQSYAWPAPGEKTLCLVRDSNRSFFGSLDLKTVLKLYNTGNITSNLTRFDEIWGGLTSRMVDTIASKSKYYVYEVAPLTSDDTIYAFMQCTLDLSPENCKTCLRASVENYHSCCRGRQGGAVVRQSCFFRWDLYPYFGVFDNITFSPPPKPTPQLPPPPATPTARNKDGKTSTGPIVAIVVLTVIVVFVLLALGCSVYRKKKSYQAIEGEANALHSLKFDLRIVKTATNDFSVENKLGEGGFGPVYKGKLPDGQEIAVKRLSKHSGQGEQEFKNEVMLLSGLRHRNLVRLLGYCIKGDERLLIYEFLPNSSLDALIFESVGRLQVPWSLRYNIIRGIARGLLYLHEDSGLTIIHRDLKPSNILLEEEMNPKISDFGIARFFSADETHARTSRVVGTYGYMAPEYIKRGLFSVKSDVYSFGIMILEIICGQKNGSVQPSGLANYAWMKWRDEQAFDIVDPVIISGSKSEIMRCIQIGLLCVQENLSKRPTMHSIILWLSSDIISLPVPTTPAFVIHNTTESETSSSYQKEPDSSNMETGENFQGSLNKVSITELEPR